MTVEPLRGPGRRNRRTHEAGNTPETAFELAASQGAAPSGRGLVAPGLDDVDLHSPSGPAGTFARVTVDLTEPRTADLRDLSR